MRVLVQDVRYAFRGLRASPAFTVVTALTVALGVGANSSVFSVVDAVLLKPLPFADPDRIVLLWATSPTSPAQPLTPGNFVDFRLRVKSLAGLSGISHIPLTLTGAGYPERVPGMSVSTDFFHILGVEAALGRTFQADDVERADVVVLSHRMWMRRLSGDRDLVGRTLTVNGRPHLVAGVMPASFTLPSITPQASSGAGPELWIPAGPDEIPQLPIARPDNLRDNRRFGYLRAVGRLRPGMTRGEAEAEVATLAAQLEQEHPRENARVSARLDPLPQPLVGSARRPLLVLLAAVAFVLLITCANVASLLLGRAAARRQEIAIRIALGASRRRLVRQLLTESLVLALVSAGVGLLLARVTLEGLVGLSPAELLGLREAAIDLRVVVFALGLALLTGMGFGLAPALTASSTSLEAALREGAARGSAGPSNQRSRRLLVAGELAVASLLLTGAVLLIQSLLALMKVHPGYDARNVLAFELYLSGPVAEYQSRQVALYEDLLGRVRSLPGVESAAAIVNLPVGGDDFGAPIVIEGAPPPEAGAEPRANLEVASAGYFQTMRIPLLAGRDFAASDTRDAAPVVIVNETLAQSYAPDGNAVGRRLRLGSIVQWHTIIGVVGDVRHGGPAAPREPQLYQPYTQSSFPFMSFVVRTAPEPEALIASVRQVLARIDPTLPMAGVSTLEERLGTSRAETRFLSALLGGFAGMALLLAALGVYSVAAYAVTARSREIGIRVALGAEPREVVALIVRGGSQVIAAGLLAGVALSFASARAISRLLFGVSAREPLTLALVPLGLALVALAATYVPARQAGRIDPVVAMRVE